VRDGSTFVEEFTAKADCVLIGLRAARQERNYAPSTNPEKLESAFYACMEAKGWTVDLFDGFPLPSERGN
jgi:hypothetical protein